MNERMASENDGGLRAIRLAVAGGFFLDARTADKALQVSERRE